MDKRVAELVAYVDKKAEEAEASLRLANDRRDWDDSTTAEAQLGVLVDIRLKIRRIWKL